MHKIRKDDMVKVIAGKDKDKIGKVLHVDTKKNTVLVEGCNMVTKHTKPSQTNQNGRKLPWTSPMLCCSLTEKQQELVLKLRMARKYVLPGQLVK